MALKIALERSGQNFEQGKTSNFIDIFSPLPKIEKLGGYIQYLSGRSIPEKLPNMISYLTNLQMNEISFSEPREISLLLCFLKNFPNLEELEVMPIWSRFPEFTGNGCSLPQLQKVTIEAYTIFEMAMDSVEYLLAVSPSLYTYIQD